MAVNIFDQFGIKEVANVYFEALEDDKAAGVYAGDVVLYLDTLKVSTIETTAENVAAQGGWGNPRLVMWDYGKEINLTLEDALLSLESLRFMLGGAIKTPSNTNKVIVHHTEEVVAGDNGVVPKPKDHLTHEVLTPKAYPGRPIRLINLTTGVRTQLVHEGTSGSTEFTGTKAIVFKNTAAGLGADGVKTVANDRIRIFWEEELVGAQTETETAVEVTISPSTFPGTYKVVGDTYMRSANGKDEPFQFIINKAKVQSEVTITLEAEGDPSTFEMTLNVLRSTNEQGEEEMMKLIRYSVGGSTTDSNTGNDIGSLATGSGT